MTGTKLHLVIVYSAGESTYSLSKHNQPSDEAKDFIEKFNPHMKPGYTLITLEQRKPHKTEEVQNCEACRETVRRRSGLQPIPKFVRRKE